MQDALTEFGEANGIDITYVGRRDFEQQINAQVLGGNPPDIAAFPQPGKLKQFAQDGDLLPVPDDVVASVSENWADSYLAFSNVDGTQYGVPFKSDLKSLRVVPPERLGGEGLHGPRDPDRLQGADGRDDRQRRHPAVRRHRVRPGHRLAVHRLGRGAGPARAGHRLLQPVGQPRGPVQRPAGGRHVQRGRRPGRLLDEGGRRVRVRRVDRRHRVRRQRRRRWSRASA